MTAKPVPSGKLPVQTAIEDAMHEFGISQERFESIYLFSSDGLLLASRGESSAYSREALLEFSFSLLTTVSLLDSEEPLHEILIRGADQRHLVFRYFHAWDEDMILAAVVPGKKGYRRALNRLLTKIRRLS